VTQATPYSPALIVSGQISPQVAAALLGKLRSSMTTEQRERRGDERELLEGSSEDRAMRERLLGCQTAMTAPLHLLPRQTQASFPLLTFTSRARLSPTAQRVRLA
jgi:hypothetical protein